MKIIIPFVVNFSAQGGYRVLSQLANNWIEMGHEVDFLVYKDFTKPYFPTRAKMIRYDGLGNLVETDYKNDFKFLGTLQLIWAMEKALDKLSADIVLATQCFTASPVWKSRINAKKFYYIQAYEPEFYNEKSLKYLIYKYIAKKSYYYPLQKIVNSEMYFDYQEIKANMVVYPGLDFNDFYPKETEFIKKEKYIIGTIGRVEKIKGTQYILEAFKILREKYNQQIELHIAFGDDYWMNFDGVKLFRPKNDTELGDYYRSLDIYICASTFQLQAIHYPVIESMSSKTILITTGYYPANENNSYLVKVKDKDAIVNTVEKVINHANEAELKAKNALKDIKQFDWKTVSKKMIEYFNNAQ
ncbi:glycosyltransferase family 4 protein [Chryseobacterium gwangjuense]|uniref:glycosyltransferase family 4 protein n=1 Tax=Chryseobacterium gwangjuense TaxID=1069980 RepID=UPI001E55D202|nr:glycosyltransferase family 4 protein [Chryseobacterium gwangjuense]MCE3076564.1 glycosyltransferase family 4 protein [Chryseobacterium gwangjuense]